MLCTLWERDELLMTNRAKRERDGKGQVSWARYRRVWLCSVNHPIWEKRENISERILPPALNCSGYNYTCNNVYLCFKRCNLGFWKNVLSLTFIKWLGKKMNGYLNNVSDGMKELHCVHGFREKWLVWYWSHKLIIWNPSRENKSFRIIYPISILRD